MEDIRHMEERTSFDGTPQKWSTVKLNAYNLYDLDPFVSDMGFTDCMKLTILMPTATMNIGATEVRIATDLFHMA